MTGRVVYNEIHCFIVAIEFFMWDRGGSGRVWGGHGDPKWTAGHRCGNLTSFPVSNLLFIYYMCATKFFGGCHIIHKLAPPLIRKTISQQNAIKIISSIN